MKQVRVVVVVVAAVVVALTNSKFLFFGSHSVCGKGCDEVMSFVHDHILKTLHGDTEHLIIHYDGCAGQAANHPFLCFCADLLDPSSPFYIEHLKRITLKRNPVGHTFCECDTAHGQVSNKAKTLCGGVVHTAYTLPNAAADGLSSWQQVILACGYDCVVVTQEMVFNYKKYLLGGFVYKSSVQTSYSGVDGPNAKWLISEQHMFQLGCWDLHRGPNQAPQQEYIRGVVRTSKTWKFTDESYVCLWREKGNKKDNTFRVDVSNINKARKLLKKCKYLNAHAGLPTRKYLQLFKLCVLKIFDLRKNAVDCGKGPELIIPYPALTATQLVDHTRMVAERRKKNVVDEFAN